LPILAAIVAALVSMELPVIIPLRIITTIIIATTADGESLLRQ
jgi:hypothetical protein